VAVAVAVSSGRRSRPSRLAPLAWALAALAGASVVAGCTNPADDPGLPVAVDPAVIYAQTCARCHGADGRGDPQVRQQIPVRDFTDPAFLARAGSEDIARVIMAGKGQMPSFGSMLSQPKIQSLSGYVRRLGKGQVIR
jgi:mono/diheme cytochrome c family protein